MLSHRIKNFFCAVPPEYSQLFHEDFPAWKGSARRRDSTANTGSAKRARSWILYQTNS